jgi:hypothetical protein
MRCKKVQKLIIAYLDNELSNRRQYAIQIHIARCPNCSAELESYQKLNGIIEQCPKVEDRSPLFWQNQIKAIEQKVATVQSGKKPEPAIQLRRYQPVWYKFAAATATISIVAIILILHQSHQPVSSIVAIEKVPNTLIAAKPSAPDKSEEDKKIAQLRMDQPEPSKSLLPEIINKKSLSPVETTKELVDKLDQMPKAAALYDTNGDRAESMTAKQIARIPNPTSPDPAAEEMKSAKGTLPNHRPSGNFADSTDVRREALKSKGGQDFYVADKSATTGTAGMELARGTSLNLGLQQAEQTVFFDRGTIARNIQVIPVAAQAKDQFNLAFDSANMKMIQDAMEMMVQTNFPNQQNQRTIEIKEIPQPAVSSTRHLQIKMDFQP